MTEPSVFARILAGELPGEIIHRDETVAALLTIQPFNPGHVLVVPTEQVDHLWDLPEDTYAQVFAVARRMAEAIRAAWPEYARVGMAVEGFEVPHAHVHVFGMNTGFQGTLPQKGESVPFADAEDLADAAGRLRAALGERA